MEEDVCGGGGERPVFTGFENDEKIYFDGVKATSAEGTIAGSTKLLPDIVKIIGNKNLFNPQFIENPYIYHNLDSKGEIEWDEDFNIVKVKY